MKMKSKLTHTFNIEHNGIEYEIECSVTLIHDPNYGADADGNRGIPMDFLEEIIIINLPNDVQNLPEFDQKIIEKLATEQVKNYEWNFWDS